MVRKIQRNYLKRNDKLKKIRFKFFSLNFYSRFLFIITLLISMIGLFFVFEASVAESYVTFGHQYYFLRQQSIGMLLGFFSLAIGFIINPKFWQKFSPAIFAISIVLLILVFVPGIGMKLNGASRWISMPGFRLQPVELFKFALIAFHATWMVKNQKIGTFLFFTLMPALLIILQPDLGSLLIVVWIAFGLFFIAGGKLKMISVLGVVGIALLGIAILLSPYRMKRITTYLNPELDPLGAGFHVRQITLALGNGGWFGQGLGNSKQKYSYIPEASSDSIFAIVAEEVGFIGSLIIIFLYMTYFWIAYKIIAKLEKDSFEYLLGWGIILWIAGQMILNLSAVVVLVPLTGLPLPFFSYGSSSLVMILFITGILMGLAKNTQNGHSSK
jgi:cell division protein FtsW